MTEDDKLQTRETMLLREQKNAGMTEADLSKCKPACEFRDGGLCTCGGQGDPCPKCDGNGGEMDGYYEPEWSDCQCCFGSGRASPERVAEFDADVAYADAVCEQQIAEWLRTEGMKS